MRRAAWVALVLVGCAAREPVAAPPPRAATEPPCPAVPAPFSAQPASAPPILSLVKRSPLLHDRPYVVEVPFRYDPDLAAPLIVEIHGFGDEPFDVERFLGLTPVASEHGALLVTVTGSHDSHERRFWNATDACCDVEQRAPDDVAYLDAVLDDVSQRFKVDSNRVYLVGHSNGGFMAHRYACERSERVAGFVSIAGAGWLDPERCQPNVPVAALQIIGDADPIVHARGGSVREPGTLKVLHDTGLSLPANLRLGRYPDVHTSLAPWIKVDQCAATTEPGKPLDLDYKIRGDERPSSAGPTAVPAWSCGRCATPATPLTSATPGSRPRSTFSSRTRSSTGTERPPG